MMEEGERGKGDGGREERGLEGGEGGKGVGWREGRVEEGVGREIEEGVGEGKETKGNVIHVR